MTRALIAVAFMAFATLALIGGLHIISTLAPQQPRERSCDERRANPTFGKGECRGR